MNYIVFDLEWNQNPDGRRHPDSRLPFEIIEIGAVKLNEKREIVDTFQCLIKPKVYHWIHDSIHEVIHVDYHELEKGIPFPRAIRRFLEWCGEEYRFFTWGDQDVMELQRNMKYYNLLKLMPGPVHYYDVQKLFQHKIRGWNIQAFPGICYRLPAASQKPGFSPGTGRRQLYCQDTPGDR